MREFYAGIAKHWGIRMNSLKGTPMVISFFVYQVSQDLQTYRFEEDIFECSCHCAKTTISITHHCCPPVERKNVLSRKSLTDAISGWLRNW